jgi:hypothetical protein
MNARRRKKAFNKLMQYKQLTKKESRCAIDYAVEHFGSLSKPMLIRDMAMRDSVRLQMQPAFDKIYFEFLDSQGIKIPAKGVKVVWSW